MNQELQSKLIEIVTSIQSTTKSAGDFAMEQLPDIAMQYVVYGRVKTSVVTLSLLIAAIICFYISRWAYKNPWNISDYSWDKDKTRSESNTLTLVGMGLLGIFLTVLSVSFFDFLVWFAPKAWLLKELAGLMK